MRLIKSTAVVTVLALTATTGQALDDASLERLRRAAEKTNSHTVTVLEHGETIADWRFGSEPRPIELMSVLKSVVALGVGVLVTDGRIASLDTPVHTWYPAWKQGRKRDITLRHLLDHTSGLQNDPNAGAEIYPAPNAVELALAAELDADPGSRFAYNNKAVNLLAGIIHQASGERMDRFLDHALLAPLGIPAGTWYLDPSGTPHAMAGLQLDALDLARLGQLVLDRGRVGERQLVAASFIDTMLAAGQEHYPLCGLLWWRLPERVRYVLDDARMVELAKAGVSGDVLDRLGTLAGEAYTSRTERNAALERALGRDWGAVRGAESARTGITGFFRLEHGEIVAYYAEGFLGQYLVVVPDAGIVAVRQVARADGYDASTDLWSDFPRFITNLVLGGS